jgi:phage anti-repressor protein
MENLKIVANEMLPVYENESKDRIVNARELHEQLMSKRHFTEWINTRIQNYGFIEGEDFFTQTRKSTGGRPSTEYYFVLDTAKEMAMVENNEQGRAIRKYFIGVEKQQRQNQQKPKSQAELSLMMAQQLVEYEKRINNLEANTAAAHHRIDNFDKVDTIGDLQQRLNKMIRLYSANHGLSFQQAWRNFKQAFNTAYRTNITMLIENYKMNNNLKSLTMPEYLGKVGRLDDAIRVADKLINQSSKAIEGR